MRGRGRGDIEGDIGLRYLGVEGGGDIEGERRRRSGRGGEILRGRGRY